MTTCEQVIKAAECAYWRERFREMPDADIITRLRADLGLPAGATFSEQQLDMILQHCRTDLA
jgi:hypothetical protein